MEVQDISKVMNAYISNQEMLGGALIVRKNDEIIYQNKWGFQNLEHSRSIEYDTMYRLMSMSKCVTGVAVMKLIEEGKIRLDDKVSKYIPEFAGLPVCCDPRYISQNLKKRKMVWNLLTFRMDKVKTEPAKREITIRDLLSHASGLEQGWVGLLSFMKMKPEDKSLEERIRRYTSYILDFQRIRKRIRRNFCGMVLIGMKPDAADCMVRLRIMNIWRGCFAVMECIRENNF